MAIVHRLTNTDVDTAYTTDFTGTTIFPAAGSWQFNNSGDGFCTYTFTAVVKGSDSTIMAAVQKLNETQEHCRLFWKGTYRDPIWYEYSADAETARRCLVVEIGVVPEARNAFLPTLGKNAAFFNVAIVCYEEWEDRTVGTTIINAVSMSTLFGWSVISAQSGSFPSRISKLILTAGPSAGLYKYWCGIRPTGDGVSSFNGKWELDLGNHITATDSTCKNTTIVSDTDGGTTNVVQCSFADPSMQKRTYMTVDDACSDTNYHHYTGRYNVLMRCRLTSAGTATILMKSGYGATNMAPAEYKTITNTSHQLISLGEVLIPPMGQFVNFYGSGINRTFRISIFAELNTGSGALNMDCLLLVPADHYTSGIGCTIDNAGAYSVAYTHEDGSHGGYSLDSSDNPSGALELGFREWELPIGGGLFVICAERNGSQVRADTVSVTLAAVHRHRLYND